MFEEDENTHPEESIPAVKALKKLPPEEMEKLIQDLAKKNLDLAAKFSAALRRG